jgi:hypothetical protein
MKLESQIASLDERIRSTLGNHVSYDSIQRMLQNTPHHELEKRRDTLTTRSSGGTERIGQLQLRQGEINQEMKTLAGDRRLAEARFELASLERQIELCADHWRTLGFTTCMLEKVCEIYESERQPETLREASAFLKQLTEGKYVRVWTPLGKNALRIDNDKGQSLPLEVLSRGTREAVFISLRLSLAAAYSRRGATLPLVLDDVLVNFDTIRATSAAKVLRDFAALGHQVVMFTCHEHIMRMFDSIGVQVRVLPTQGQAGVAEVYSPERTPQRVIDSKPTAIIEVQEAQTAMEAPVQPAALPQEPDPILLPARTRVLAKQEPLVEPKIASLPDEPLVDAVPLWFEQEWPDQDWTGQEWTGQEWHAMDEYKPAEFSANLKNREAPKTPKPLKYDLIIILNKNKITNGRFLSIIQIFYFSHKFKKKKKKLNKLSIFQMDYQKTIILWLDQEFQMVMIQTIL